MLLGFYSKGREAGKDTAGQFVQEWASEHDLTSQRLAFADLPKLLVAEILGFGVGLRQTTRLALVDCFKFDGYVERSVSAGRSPDRMSGRDFIINLCGELGTDSPSGARKLFGEDFWINAILPLDWQSEVDVTVVTDVRDNREAWRISDLGGTIIEIHNSRASGSGGRSEQGIDPSWIDTEIYNEGTLEEFKVAVQALLAVFWTRNVH